eukprot:7025745-Alexandrium_andersonii.AAC.1
MRSAPCTTGATNKHRHQERASPGGCSSPRQRGAPCGAARGKAEWRNATTSARRCPQAGGRQQRSALAAPPPSTQRTQPGP